ncbi:hypothetical protein CSA17_04795 [bacterium DOLJORAL78_65_58]|nr:MAG: hypothetical protein CSB20_08370 [bacterium DOLZORAL124_64_63]PIE75947.1 MAG: hypothetical protein CSA17_04795 [bacterium DOLJORAL78_65_58]
MLRLIGRKARIRLKLGTACLWGAAVLLCAGCAPQLDRIELAVQENHDEMSLLKAENKRLMAEVRALNELLRMDRNAGDESTAMRLNRLSMLSNQIDQLMNKLDDNAEYMRDLSARVDLLATRTGTPTLGEYKPPTRDAAASGAPVEEGQAIFDMAVLDHSQGNTDLARQGFEEFLRKYPDSEVADDAIYWLGDLAYANGEQEKALEYFGDLLQRYPVAEFAPAALYKSRSALLALGRKKEAWDMGGRLLKQFPDSPEAALLIEERKE